ncbi:alpha/beta fold hydrolase [Tropicimonas sediminicola]|uniref:Pimeloyl-ACP methyl ester carboxylesterase n=1 Tax=Tropicimonas sediminicola TaxID=1031541 RepID=A0A239KYT7_9RHOB|nr:alpha/beta hydrolase [Tropicimonas sediminicola]SNT23381.1 Pimeloyl-ACP methyl ester carboxylesterase [Tropicimonas sediminicola]
MDGSQFLSAEPHLRALPDPAPMGRLSPPLQQLVATEHPEPVFLPGLFETPHVWADIIHRLDLADPLCLDLPGHGAADWGERLRPKLRIDAWLDAAARSIEQRHGETGVVLVGHSTGGLLALALAARRPELISGLFLVGALTSGDRGRRFDPCARAMMLPGIGRPLARLFWSAWLRTPARFRRGLDAAAGMALDAPWAEDMRRALLGCDPDAVSACAEWVLTADIGHLLERVDAPVLSLIGTRDIVVPPHHQLELIRKAPKAQAMLIDGGHLLFAESPGDVATALRGWLQHCGRIA